MSNEIQLNSVFANHKFENQNIAYATEIINNSSLNIKASMLRVCGVLSMLKDDVTKDDFKNDGFADVWDYAYQVFGIKTPTARRMAAVGSAFIREGKCVLGDNETWTYSTLVEMLPIKDIAKRLVDEGRITSTMGVIEVKSIVQEVKPKKASRGRSAKKEQKAEPLEILAIGPCVVSDHGIRAISLDGGRTVAFTLDGLTDNQVKNRLYKAVRDMLDSVE